MTPSTVARQAPLSMGLSGMNTGVDSHFLLQGNLPDSGIKPVSPALHADSLLSEPTGVQTQIAWQTLAKPGS